MVRYTQYNCGFFVFFADEKLNIKILTPKDRENILRNQLLHIELVKKRHVSYQYIGDINGKEVCEQVNFNKYISNIYVYPRLVTSTWDE